MALDTVPWFIGAEGAEHSPSVARMLAYAATNGATGVISPGDLKVTALPTPGAAVRIAPGGAVLLNRYPGASNQSYTVRNATATDVDVTATGSSGGATKYLILRVDDPEFGGPTPADPKSGPYVRPVWVNSITNLAYPFVLLSKLVQPANTATITNAMLTDPRQLVSPRRESFVEMGTPVVGAKMESSGGTFYPSFRPSIAVPDWAGEVSIIATISSIASVGGNTYGEMALSLGGPIGSPDQVRSANTNYDVDLGGVEARHTFTIGAKEPVPEAIRGTVQQLNTEFRRIEGPGYLVTRRGTNVVYQITFYETAV